MELKNAKITKILEKETGTKKDGTGDWVKQKFIVKTTEKYNNVYCFELFGDEKVNNFNKYNKVGDLVDVDFNVSTNEWKGKYFTTLQVWKVFKTDVNNIDVKSEKVEATNRVYDVKEEQSDLPF
jgi:Pyruvate/2-oxoacid:ferredoxin oxidoreductase delta subunit